MISRTHGAASASQVLENNLQSYTIWCKSSDAYTNPEDATGVNIQFTGDIADETQKNFEVIIQSVGLRAMPIILDEPVVVKDLAEDGAIKLNGEGFVWRFGVEQIGIFATKESDVGLLIEEIDNIVLPNGVVLKTAGHNMNIEFEKE